LVQDRRITRARVELAQRHTLPEEWRRVSGSDQMTLYVTPEEMKEINDEILQILFRYRERIEDHSGRADRSWQALTSSAAWTCRSSSPAQPDPSPPHDGGYRRCCCAPAASAS
jgi:hypothetical protein